MLGTFENRSVALVLALFAGGCSGARQQEEGSERPPNHGSERPNAPDRTGADDSEPLDTFPPHGEARPTTLRISNGRTEPIQLVVSHGRGQPFTIEPRAGEPRFWLGSDGPLVASASCDCRCGYGCLQCEPPRYEEFVVAPGDDFDFEWSGRVRVGGEGCFHPYAAPPGPRDFEACLGDLSAEPRDCVRATVELPTSRVELRFEEPDAD